MSSVVVIDYGMGNLHSIAKALEHAGGRVEVSRDPARIRAAERLVFPGVGAIRHCMEELERLELAELIREQAGQRPLLGVCLGMQAMLDFSEENEGTRALGLFPGRVRRFPEGLTDAAGTPLKVPHMGWNQVETRAHPLWDGIASGTRFYFVHSYYVDPARASDVRGWTEYGLGFASAIGRDNVFAVQFHPEKSQQAGLRLLANFLAWDGTA